MKKILAISILGLFLAGMIMPVVAEAITVVPDSCKLTRTISTECAKDIVYGVTKNPEYCLINTIYNITDWIFYILISVVVIMVIAGGGYYISSGGDPEKADKGRELIIYAIIGLAIVSLAKIIPAIIKVMLGMS